MLGAGEIPNIRQMPESTVVVYYSFETAEVAKQKMEKEKKTPYHVRTTTEGIAFGTRFVYLVEPGLQPGCENGVYDGYVASNEENAKSCADSLSRLRKENFKAVLTQKRWLGLDA